MNLRRWVTRWSPETLVRVACWLALPALLLMAWSVLVPTVVPVLLGMSLGQGLGVIAFLCYLLAVLSDSWRQRDDADHDERDTQAP